MVSESRKEQAVIAQTDMIIKFHKAIWNEIVYNLTTHKEYENMKTLQEGKRYTQISEEIKKVFGIGKDSVRNGKPCLCTIIDKNNAVEGNKSKNYEKFLSDLAYKESSNRHYCVNQFRFSGLYQIRAEGAGRTPYYHCEKDVTEWIPKNWRRLCSNVG